jgi:hypothetical protein
MKRGERRRETKEVETSKLSLELATAMKESEIGNDQTKRKMKNNNDREEPL